MIATLRRKSMLFLVLGIFALLFGMAQSASAATCASYGDGSPTNPEWQQETIDNCEVTYSDDPADGSELAVCEYRVLSNGTQTVVWTNATGTCSGSSATLTIDISIGSGLNCIDNGEDMCEVQFKAEDSAGNSATGTIVTLDIDYIPPDTTPPTVSSVTSTKLDGSYKAGEVIDITVTFSESVNVTGTPQLTLETGTTDAVVNYSSGSGGIMLTFQYTVAAGHTSADLDYRSTTALAFNGGTIKDAASNDATLTLASPGASGSLGANKAIVIDTTAPGTPGTPSTTTSPTNDTTPIWTWTASTGTPASYTVYWDTTAGGTTNSASVTTNSFTHTTALAEGTWYMKVKAFDAAGNPSVFSSSGLVVIDTTPPVITDTAPATNAFINSQKISYTLSETVASASVVFTRTGGTADGASPHTCALRGTALDAVAHTDLTLGVGTNACSAWTALVSEAVYTVTFDATDAAGNPATRVTNTSVTYDTTAPTLAQVTAVPSPTNDTTPNYIFSSTESGAITYGGDCSSTTVTASTDNNTITFNTLAPGTHSNCTIIVTDAAGNPSSVLTIGSFTIDTTAPAVDSFTISGSSYPTVLNANSQISIRWVTTETGGANLKQIEAWRAWDANGNGTLESTEWNDSSPVAGTQSNPISTKSSSFDSLTQDDDSATDNPPDGTYWYGVHIVDNALNCIGESGSHCGGVVSDALDASRTVRGPMKVVMLHNQPPVAEAGGPYSVVETQTVTLNGAGSSDPDGDPLSYSWSCTGGGLSSSTSSTPVYTAPAVSADTSYSCTLTVTDDDGATASDTETVTVRNDPCIPPASGDWDIQTTCTLIDKSYTVPENISVQSNGILDMKGFTNIIFDNAAARYIYVYPGGKLLQDDTAGFNKP